MCLLRIYVHFSNLWWRCIGKYRSLLHECERFFESANHQELDAKLEISPPHAHILAIWITVEHVPTPAHFRVEVSRFKKDIHFPLLLLVILICNQYVSLGQRN